MFVHPCNIFLCKTVNLHLVAIQDMIVDFMTKLPLGGLLEPRKP